MKLKFLGGANEVGSTSLLIETKTFTGIFEYGLTPDNPPKYPMEAPPVDYLFLSHAHLDHSGMVPWVINKYDSTLFTTDITSALSKIILRDNLKICRIEGYPAMYTKGDINHMVENTNEIKYGSVHNLKGTELLVHSAGHIPGSVMFQLNNIADHNVLFTGDINTIDTRLVKGTIGKKCDVLILEATYAGRDHELRPKIEYLFQEKVKETIENGGKVIVPAFAIGRSQEMLLVLSDLKLDIRMEGLGTDVTKLLLRYPWSIRNEKKLKKAFEAVDKDRTQKDRNSAINADVILTTSGMLDGGPVLRYIKELNKNPKNAILLTGYQVEGSNGRSLLDKGVINLHGEQEKINMSVEHYDFSAHAGQKELINFVKACDPEHIILYHSDNRELLQTELESDYKVHLPQDGKCFVL